MFPVITTYTHMADSEFVEFRFVMPLDASDAAIELAYASVEEYVGADNLDLRFESYPEDIDDSFVDLWDLFDDIPVVSQSLDEIIIEEAVYCVDHPHAGATLAVKCTVEEGL